MKPKVILFDVDGTILNTHEYIYQAFEHALEQHHETISREELQRIMGKPLIECYQILTSRPDVQDLADAHHAFQESNLDLAVPFPNTISTMESLKKRGITLAAVTTRAKGTAVDTLETNELMHHLSYVVGLEDVANPKPDPEGIIKTLTYLEVDPQDAIMVGDSDVDVFAGKNAEVKTVGVTYGFHGEHIIHAEPDFIIDDISELLQILDEE